MWIACLWAARDGATMRCGKWKWQKSFSFSLHSRKKEKWPGRRRVWEGRHTIINECMYMLFRMLFGGSWCRRGLSHKMRLAGLILALHLRRKMNVCLISFFMFGFLRYCCYSAQGWGFGRVCAMECHHVVDIRKWKLFTHLRNEIKRNVLIIIVVGSVPVGSYCCVVAAWQRCAYNIWM